MKRKLIEVALPLEPINVASSKEKSIRHGHPSTLHLWWARRPLAACRAVLFAQLVDDPSSHPEEFPTEEAQDTERQRLFGIIEELVKWENSTDEKVLQAARVEILNSTGGDPPLILDPFAGGGSIPLEAQRLGLEAYASDLNPVAVLINKALIEIPPKWAGQPPVHPDAEQRMSWSGAQGLSEDVRKYGAWMRDEAEKRTGHLYPKAKLEDGSEANVIAWIWARTVTCPNPACGANMPLASTFWLSKANGREAWVKPVVEGKHVKFEIGRGSQGPPDPPKIGRGARFKCIVCGTVTSDQYVKSSGRSGGLGERLTAVVAKGDIGRIFLKPDSIQEDAAVMKRPLNLPNGLMPRNPRWFSPPAFGFETFASVHTNRNVVMLNELAELATAAQESAASHATSAGLSPERAAEYGVAIATYCTLAIDRLVMTLNSLSRWNATGQKVQHMFGRQALPMVWDFAEANPLGSSTGSLGAAFEMVSDVLSGLPANGVAGIAAQLDARKMSPRQGVIATDPPYYDNIGYADLSDVFYVWIRDPLRQMYPSLFETLLVPKEDELIATPVRHEGSKDEADKYFEAGFVEVFSAFQQRQNPSYPMTFFYAFRQSESADSDGLGSTGWATMLEGLLKAGWMVTATWPMRTEMATRLVGRSTNSLASSVVLACRRRELGAGITDRQGFLRRLGERLPAALVELLKASIAPVDLRQAAIGPGMAVFSQYEKVVEPDSSAMRVRTALGLINQVLDQVLDEQQAEFDRETRWAIQWFSQFFEDEGPYGTAETLAVSMDVSIDRLRDAGVLYSGGGKVRLLSRVELSDDWDPARDSRTPVWEAAQHLVKRLEEHGEAAAADLFNQLGALADSAQTLATILYTKAERTRPGLAGPYNALVASWPTIQRLARQAPPPTQPEQPTLTES